MEINYEQLIEQVDDIPSMLATELQRELSKYLDKCGLYYRIFSRCKTGQSAAEKIRIKGYTHEGKMMQDLIGIRAVLYFKDDVDICVSIIEKNFHVIDKVQDTEKVDTFHPVRLNLVCEMPRAIAKELESLFSEYPIDRTFEIQVRTIFSEGWHEIEHDVRYKNKGDWDGFVDLSRSLNGIFAVLETCDWSILKILDGMSYEKYKSRDWEAMLRNHFRLRVGNSELSTTIKEQLDHNPELAKKVFRADRAELLFFLSDSKTNNFPKNLNNIVYIINALLIKNDELSKITPNILKEQVEKYLQSR